MAHAVLGTAVTTLHNFAAGFRAVNMPASLVAGNRILAFAMLNQNVVIEAPDIDWTEYASIASTHCYRLFVKTTNGAEGATQSFYFTQSSECSWITIQVSASNIEVLPFAQLAAKDWNEAEDPPSCTAPWGATNNVFLACAANSNVGSTGTYTAVPSGYTQAAIINSNGIAGKQCIAYKNSLLATEDPGAFTVSGSIADIVATIVLSPASVIKSLRFLVKDEIGNLLVSQTGLKMNVFDGPIGHDLGNPILSVDNATSDASGYCTLDVTTSAQSLGGICTVISHRGSNKYGVAENVDIIEL